LIRKKYISTLTRIQKKKNSPKVSGTYGRITHASKTIATGCFNLAFDYSG